VFMSCLQPDLRRVGQHQVCRPAKMASSRANPGMRADQQVITV
jgi:hypothetical protein